MKIAEIATYVFKKTLNGKQAANVFAGSYEDKSNLQVDALHKKRLERSRKNQNTQLKY